MRRMSVMTGILVASSISLSAATLKEVVGSVLDTNPIVKERLKNYRATKAEIGVAEAGYYPTVDLKSAAGRKAIGRISSKVTEQTYNVFQNSVIIRQNLFNGFSTHERVNYQKMRTLAAAYSYLEKTNDVALQTLIAYTDLQKEKELLNNSITNVKHNELIYKKVQKAYKAGLSTRSEVSKILSSLSLAKSNQIVQKNRLMNAYTNFRRVVGRMVKLEELKPVSFNLKLPKNLEKAEMYALEYNPSILVGEYNIKGAEALYRESKSNFYPSLDLELSQNYNKNYNEFSGIDDRTQGMVVASYNLFNGGADEAKRKNKLSKLSQEVEVTNDLKRQVIESVDLSWNAYELSRDQMSFLISYKKQSSKTLELYQKEYDLGERSMLDLISAENDLKRANDELIQSRYNLLIAKYRIVDAMGLTIASILGSEEKYYKRVGICTTTPHKRKTITDSDLERALKTDKHRKDSLPVSLDADADKIPDNKDVSPNSLTKNNIMPSGTSTSMKGRR
jgi:adhesin transport system outer membrane protein